MKPAPNQTHLLDAFVAHLDEDGRAQAAQTSALGMVLAELVAVAAAPWPDLGLQPVVFVAYLAERLPGHSELVAEMRSVRAEDLYLACACCMGSNRAIAAFDERYLGFMTGTLGRMNIPESTRDEVIQQVRERLFVAESGTPRIGDYAGRGDLRNWIRATAVRTCLNLLRKHKREVDVDDERVMAALPAEDDDPELAHMKELYRDEFRRAFAAALAALPARTQNLLRYYYVDELTIDELGAIYRVHRVTAFRWVNKARESLVAATHDQLRSQLHISDTEMNSILRLIRSEIDLSLARHLA